MTMKRMVLNESVTSVPMAPVYLKTSTSQIPRQAIANRDRLTSAILLRGCSDFTNHSN